jgi:hypothetical protein
LPKARRSQVEALAFFDCRNKADSLQRSTRFERAPSNFKQRATGQPKRAGCTGPKARKLRIELAHLRKRRIRPRKLDLDLCTLFGHLPLPLLFFGRENLSGCCDTKTPADCVGVFDFVRGLSKPLCQRRGQDL